jgi:Kef-type K+ transport system membrane component KefB
LLLWGGIQLLRPLDSGQHGASSETLLVFGFLILAAYTVGEITKLLHLPKITGYLFAGFVFGPAMIGVVSTEITGELEPVTRLAVALIAFLAGAELRWKELKERARAIFTILATELPLSFVLVAGTLVLLHGVVPFLADTTVPERFALASLFAAVAIVHSPAVTMALLAETRAHGPVARTTLSVVLVADVIVVLLFSAALTIARAFVGSPGELASSSTFPLAWEIGGAVIVGLVLGGAVALYLRFVQRELVLFAVLVAFFGVEVARLAHVETLLTLLVAGFVSESLSGEEGRDLLNAMERSAAPVLVVFFALAGATLHVEALAELWPVALAVVAVRALAIFVGAKVGARRAKAPDVVRQYAWMGLVSQAGVAIGLATVVQSAFPERGRDIGTLLLAVITINEVIGQIMFRVALSRAGEIREEGTAGLEGPAVPSEV